ncbi:MAG: Rossmann-like domain-containing protein [Candidatus Helarchaeota archaeon]
MSILEDLKEYIQKYWNEYNLKLKVRFIEQGAHYTICILNDDSTGLCHNLQYKKSCINQGSNIQNNIIFNKNFKKVINNSNMDTPLKLLDTIFSENYNEKSIGISCLNAISQYLLKVYNYELIFNDKSIAGLSIKEDSRIGMIGAMKPIIKKLKILNAKKIYLKENNKNCIPKDLKNIILSYDLDFIDDIDILIISGSSIINESIDIILKKSKNCQEKVLIGPTAGCIPEPFFERGLTRIAGMRIVNPEKTRDVIVNGGGTQLFKKYGQKYYIKNQN